MTSWTYRPAFSTGVYGQYCVLPETTTSQSAPRRFMYYPSISDGRFGTWLFNESSPYMLLDMKPSSKQISSSRYAFQIRGRRNEPIINEKKYNVKLLQEYRLPVGKGWHQQQTSNAAETPPQGTGRLYICKGSVVSFRGECIINAANEGMLGGGGVDGAISDAGGDALYHLRKQEPLEQGSRHVRCKTGDAKITQSGYPYNRLKCDYVIHAVGPNYSSMWGGKNDDLDKQLYTSYAKSLVLCQQYKIKTVGFCLISSGIFRGSRRLDEVLSIGIQALRDYMYDGAEVYVIGYTQSELACLCKVAPAVLGTMSKQYSQVEERTSSWGGGSRWSRNDDNKGGGGANMFTKMQKMFNREKNDKKSDKQK
eukprot:CAMPEP_0202690054 /NCGR_PEP_ID=MMETSP1385-20130828/5185_1 /ASSEMBLY_ACC=CAM_ASM_000861 /TAXON_ID=933848 /ORGANISM="Elphidium margaritaceum" /LENGTH=365 /DNA_ID=CAMNT_0049345283 /DNA_START=13 /DNA_END=1110 /DNA_ORIENTATION=-